MKRLKTHYDAIPPALLQGRVLDVGCGDGANQRISKNYPLLQACDYTGIDIETDLFTYRPKPYDTVLAIHVIEHIEKIYWNALFEPLRSWVKSQGWLVIGTPYRQSSSVYRNFTGPDNQRHRVFNIDEMMLEQYLEDDIWVYKYRGPYSYSLMVMWRNDK